MNFNQTNLQRTSSDWCVVVLTLVHGVYAFRTENPFHARDKFNQINVAGGFVVLALYSPTGELIERR